MSMRLKMFILVVTAIFMVSLGGTYAGTLKTGTSADEKAGMESQQAPSSLSGKVVETMDSGVYTYVNIENDGKNIWVAVPKMKVETGQEVAFAPGMVMKNFTSKTLNRTFEAIVFSNGPIGQNKAKSSHQSLSTKSAKTGPESTIKVEKASGSDAYTVAELHEKSSELDSKNVTVRGQVVKVSPSIMGKNWIHLQDGSGTAAKGTNDILVTSQDLPSVGDVVTAMGTLFKDKDFGSGYKYSVIMEETRFKK